MDKRKIGEIIRVKREASGLSREALAEQAGLAGGRETIRKIEDGLTNPRESTTKRIADVLGIPMGVLLSGEEGTEKDRMQQARAIGWLCGVLEDSEYNPQTAVACLQPRSMVKAYTLAAQSGKYDEALREISWYINDFPATFTADEQAQFWIGYYTRKI